MITNVVQRWRDRRAGYRPVGEVIKTSDYEVTEISQDSIAKSFVQRHHYSGSYPAARFRFGLYRKGALVGVAVFSHPSSDKVLTNVFPGNAIESVELGRLVLLDEVPANGESWFVARCFEVLRSHGILGVISYSDPVARTSLSGETTFAGHIGTVYQALGGVYLGRATSRSLKLLPDGSILSARAISKMRSLDKGWRYGVAILEAHGATPPPSGCLRRWLDYWIPQVTRTLKHPGNHKYAWILPRKSRRFLPESQPYPKFAAPAQTLLSFG